MSYLSTKNYRRLTIYYFCMFILSAVLGLALGAMKDLTLLGLAVGAGLGALFFIPCGYYLVRSLLYKKRAENAGRKMGKIETWQVGFIRGFAKIVVKEKGKTYQTPAYFWRSEAEKLVGAQVSYCVIDNTLFIYEMK